VFTLSHGNMFRLYIQPSSGLNEISPGIKSVYCMGSHIVLDGIAPPLIYHTAPSSGLKDISSGIKSVYCMGSHLVLYGIPYSTHFLYLD